MSSFLQDVRYALRMIAKAPAYAAITIVTLALGIGANTTIFSWINASLLNPVPGLAKPREVVAFSLSPDAANPFPFTYPDLEALRDGHQSFTGLTGVNVTPMSLTGSGKPRPVWGMLTSANYFDVLGVRPIMGRAFLPEEDTKPGGAPVVVISYPFLANALWRKAGHRRPDDRSQRASIHHHRRHPCHIACTEVLVLIPPRTRRLT